MGGECLEKAYCLILEKGVLDGSYAEPYLYELPNSNGRRLLPMCMGLLYGRCPWDAGANLAAEPAAEKCSDTSHWLNFNVRRPIRKGEQLLVASARKLPPIFAAAAQKFGQACYVDGLGRPLEPWEGDVEVDDTDEDSLYSQMNV